MSAEHPGTLYLKRTLLIVDWPDGTQQKFPLAQDVTRFGRGTEDNDLAAPQEFKSISRRHFEIRRSASGYCLQDLGSGNGVLVNGQPVDNILLMDGDEIRVGMAEAGQEVRLVFSAGTEIQVRAAVEEPGTQAVLAKLSPEAPHGQPYLRVRLPRGQERFFVIHKDLLVIGREDWSDLQLAYPFVSARHFELRRTGAAFTIRDLGSANGTLVNNQPLPALSPTLIHDLSIIRLGDESFGVSLSLTFYNPLEQAAPLDGFSLSASPVAVAPTRALVIGRAEECDIHLGGSDVSRRHAAIRRQGSAWILEDLGSVNGTFVNDRQVKMMELHDGSLIRIGSYVLVFQNGQLSPYQSNGMRLDVVGLSAKVKTRDAELALDDVSFSVLPREFISLVDSGGKSGLLDALTGSARPERGTVKLNGHDFYRDFEHYRSQLGFVPQENILHAGLSVEKALDFAAQLRLPVSIGPNERKKRINSVLETVSMNNESVRRMRIQDLSLGPRKRVNIAAELLTDPKLIYLDDAAAGLDPGLEKKLMYTLRRMADEGRTVVLFTQASANTVQADHVAFLSQGRLIYFGPSRQALEFFDVEEFADIYEKIERSGDEWRDVYQYGRPEIYQSYVLDRQASSQTLPAFPSLGFDASDMLRHFSVLVQRTLNVLLSKPLTLAAMVLLLPLTGFLQLLVGSRDILTGSPISLATPVAATKTLLDNYLAFGNANSFLFAMGLEAVLAGLLLPVNDLTSERAIIRRERMVGLGLLPYLLSKVFVYGLFIFTQVLLYLAILSLGIDFPQRGQALPGFLEIFVTLLLVMTAGASLGLIVSAASRSRGMLYSLLGLLFFFQLVFSGTLFDLRGSPVEPVSFLTITRWSQTALSVSMDLPGRAENSLLCGSLVSVPQETACVHIPDGVLPLDYRPEWLGRSWLVLSAMSALFLVIVGIILRKRDAITSKSG